MVTIASFLYISFVFLAISVVDSRRTAPPIDETPKAVQIVTPDHHAIHLELSVLKGILEADNIRDRHVVVVSIAGAFRQGKSFLMNFFIRYLNAQYKKLDVSDWLGENGNDTQLSGFKYRGGQKSETMGIWMWSEIFTHNFASGEKVAIVLLDTQGIFDYQSSLRECTTTFAMSMMLSSVQCYNLMGQITENDLQNLELFTEYGRIAVDQSGEKPFQSLIFVVRDARFSSETGYGWEGTKRLNDILANSPNHTPDMKELRDRIRSSFNEIRAFLMPYPGDKVALGNGFTGNITEIDQSFIKYVKELVPSIFAPENLIIKKINGQNMRARDLVQYFQSYVNIFNTNKLPETKSWVQATAETSVQILFNDCLNRYVASMNHSIKSIESFYKANQLMKLHEQEKEKSINEFRAKAKLGSNKLISSTEDRLRAAMDERYEMLQQQNEARRIDYTKKISRQSEVMKQMKKEEKSRNDYDDEGEDDEEREGDEEDEIKKETKKPKVKRLKPVKEPEERSPLLKKIERTKFFMFLGSCVGAAGGVYLGGPLGAFIGASIGGYGANYIHNAIINRLEQAHLNASNQTQTNSTSTFT